MNRFNATRNREQCISIFRRWNNEIEPPIETLPEGIEGIVDMFLEEGGIIVGGEEGKDKGIAGFVLGEPKTNFKDKSIGYVYLMVVPKEYRGGRTFYQLCKATLKEMAKAGAKEVRFKSYRTSNYQNNLYRKIANQIGEEPNSQGIPSLVFSLKIEEMKKRFSLE